MPDQTQPAPVVRSDRIERAAQVFCDSSRNGQRWVDLSEPFRDLYRRRVRALADAGLLADPSSVDRHPAVPAEIPANVVVLPEDWRHLTYYPIAGHTNAAEAADAVNALIESWRPTPAEQPAAEPEPCVITDVAGDTVRVTSLLGPRRIAVDTTDTTWLTPDQADQLADALRAHAAARRAESGADA